MQSISLDRETQDHEKSLSNRKTWFHYGGKYSKTYTDISSNWENTFYKRGKHRISHYIPVIVLVVLCY